MKERREGRIDEGSKRGRQGEERRRERERERRREGERDGGI